MKLSVNINQTSQTVQYGTTKQPSTLRKILMFINKTWLQQKIHQKWRNCMQFYQF